MEVTVVGDPETVEVRVADDGPGLPDDAAERVFERFVSLDGLGGSGLGLPIAQDFARAQGGDLRYEDHQFVVTFPLALAAEPPPEAEPPASELRERPDLLQLLERRTVGSSPS